MNTGHPFRINLPKDGLGTIVTTAIKMTKIAIFIVYFNRNESRSVR